MDLNNR